jgi:hypothetical protein
VFFREAWSVDNDNEKNNGRLWIDNLARQIARQIVSVVFRGEHCENHLHENGSLSNTPSIL